MFSNLCRACMVELDPTDIVPLFEKYQNVFLNRICNVINLSLDEDDNLGQNVCKDCAESIIKFYKFHTMYTKSNEKLRALLSQSIDSKNLKDDVFVPHVESIVQASLGISDTKFKCRKCSAGFRMKSLLRNHISQVHDGESVNSGTSEGRWKCSNCMAHFRTRDLKNKHQKECRRTNTSRDNNDATEIKESEFVDYNNFDTSGFPSESDANNDDDMEDRDIKYELDTTAGEKWKCKVCSECFETVQLLHLHQSSQHPESENKLFPHVNIKQEKLDFDELQLKTENERQESDTVTPRISNRRWSCNHCLNVCETRELLRIHRRTHPGIRRLPSFMRSGWSCNICDEVLPSRDKVRLHKAINHPKEKRERRSNDDTKNWGDVGKYECELCNKIFISKSKIRKHMDVHKNKNRPKRLCTICGLELCSTYNLNNHIRVVHGRERRFHCTVCDRKFSHSHHLKTHMNRHENIRPFQCAKCIKAFFDKTTLREHVKSVHLNLKAYACRICSRTFNRSGNMRAHMLKTHNLGNITGVQLQAEVIRPSDAVNSNASGGESDDFTSRFYPSTSVMEPLRSFIPKSSN